MGYREKSFLLLPIPLIRSDPVCFLWTYEFFEETGGRAHEGHQRAPRVFTGEAGLTQVTFASTHGCDIQLDGSFTGTELDFALDVCNGVVDVLGSWLGRCN